MEGTGPGSSLGAEMLSMATPTQEQDKDLLRSGKNRTKKRNERERQPSLRSDGHSLRSVRELRRKTLPEDKEKSDKREQLLSLGKGIVSEANPAPWGRWR